MAFVLVIPLVQFSVMIAVVPAIFVFVVVAIVLFVTVRVPVTLSMIFIAVIVVAVSKSSVLPQAQKQSHAPKQEPIFSKHFSPSSVESTTYTLRAHSPKGK